MKKAPFAGNEPANWRLENHSSPADTRRRHRWKVIQKQPFSQRENHHRSALRNDALSCDHWTFAETNTFSSHSRISITVGGRSYRLGNHRRLESCSYTSGSTRRTAG